MPEGSAGRRSPIRGAPALALAASMLLFAAGCLSSPSDQATAVPDAAVGDEVVIIGRQGALEITAAEVAAHHGLGLHHVATTVGPRVARVYVSGTAGGG